MTAASVPAMIDTGRYFGPEQGPDGTLVYRSVAVCHITGCSYRQLDYWCDRGYLNDTANGSGTARTFTPHDIDLIHAVLGLIRAGFTVPAAFRVGLDLVDHAAYRVIVADIYQLTLAVTTPKE